MRERERSAAHRANRKIIVRNEIIAALLGSFLADASRGLPRPNHSVLLSLPACLDQELGRNLARTFLDYYKSINYISWSPSSSNMPRLKEDRIKSRLTRQSTSMPIVNQDEAYEIKLVDRHASESLPPSALAFSRFLNGETFNLNMGEFIYPQTRNNNEPE